MTKLISKDELLMGLAEPTEQSGSKKVDDNKDIKV